MIERNGLNQQSIGSLNPALGMVTEELRRCFDVKVGL